MQMLLHLIIAGVSLFPNEEPLESVSNIVSVISDLAVVESEVVIQPVETEVAETEAVEQNTTDVDQVMAGWAQLDPSTRAAILMLFEADRMTHAK